MKPGQIDLFTKRVKKPPAPLERAVHIAIADTLRVGLLPGWLWFHPANGELRDNATGALLKRMGVKPGVSDFVLMAPPHGRMHVLEIKRRGMTPTPAQYEFLDSVTISGGQAAWCDSYDQAVEILKEWGALSERLHL